jgi:tRNA(Arg) A34 adenosine deaminase TadA
MTAQLYEASATQYHRDGSIELVPPEVLEAEHLAMLSCFGLAEQALQDGNPPIGAILLDHERGLSWGATTIDKTTPHLLGHAELRAYYTTKAVEVVGDDLSECSLVTTAQPCCSCTPPYVEGKIGRVIFAARRSSVYEVAGIMRPRSINMPDLLADGDTETTVVAGYMEDRALAMFGLWRKLKGERA